MNTEHNAPAADGDIPPPFRRNRDEILKLVECVLFMLHKAVESDRILSRDDITDAMFIANKTHLDVYGRYVVHDNHFATPHGPAGAELVRMLGAFYPWSDTGDSQAPWTVCGDGPQSMICMPTRAVDEDELSRTDERAMTAAFEVIDTCDAQMIKNLVCGDAAYMTAITNGAGEQLRMDPRHMMDIRDDELILQLISYTFYGEQL